MMKKFISFVSAFGILVSCFNLIASAVHNDSLALDDYFEDWYIIDITGESELSSTAPKYYYQQSADFSLSYDCYSKLDEAQRIIYDAVVSSPGELSVTIEFEKGVFSYSNWNTAYFTEVMNAICIDRPDIFYHAGYGITNGYLHSGGEYMSQLTYNVSVYDDSIYTSSNLSGYYSDLMTALKAVPVDTSNRYNFMLSVHDYLCDNIYYPDLESTDYVMSAHDAYGALVEGRAVCQGYSDAFKLICDYYKVPCVCISGVTDTGGGHMWNGMQMDDGLWYLTDATWDDQDTRLFYDFFLVGTQSTNTYFGGAQFSTEHINDTDLFLPSLNYSENAYDRTQNHNTGFDATHNAYADTENKCLYLSVFDAGKTNVYYNGIYVDISEFSNDTAFEITDNSTSSAEEWYMVLLGDINSDGECSVADYSEAVNLLHSSDDVLDTTGERACDVNVDGVIDVLDASVIARASSGLNTSIILE